MRIVNTWPLKMENFLACHFVPRGAIALNKIWKANQPNQGRLGIVDF